MFLLLWLACSGPAAGDPRERTLVVARSADPDVLLPGFVRNLPDRYLASALYEPVVDIGFDCKLTHGPALARSWSFSEDGRVLQMELAEGHTWQDGAPLTTADVAFAAEVMRDPIALGTEEATMSRMAPESPVVIDATHLEWRFTEAYDPTLMLQHVASIHPLPKHLLEGADRATFRGHPLAKAPVGSGQWKLALWKANDRLVIEPSDTWTGPRPELDRVIYRVIPESSTRLLELEAGNVDVVDTVSISDADRIHREHPDVAVVRRPYRGVEYVAWNPAVPMFADREVRRALAKAIDLDDLVKKLFTSESGEVYGARATGSIAPLLCDEAAPIEPIPFDVAAAGAELDALGWKDSDGDGIRDKGGAPFRFELMTASGNQRRDEVAVRLQAAYKAVGVDVVIERVEANVVVERLRNKDYEAAISAWGGDLAADPSPWWRSGPGHTFNVTGYANPDVDALIDRLYVERDAAKRVEAVREIQTRIYDDQPVLFLFWMDDLVLVRDRFVPAGIGPLTSIGDLGKWKLAPPK